MSYDYSGYNWIKVEKHFWNKDKSWEENYKDLEKHHIAETQFLINKVRSLAEELSHYDYAKVRQKWADDEANLERRFN